MQGPRLPEFSAELQEIERRQQQAVQALAAEAEEVLRRICCDAQRRQRVVAEQHRQAMALLKAEHERNVAAVLRDKHNCEARLRAELAEAAGRCSVMERENRALRAQLDCVARGSSLSGHPSACNSNETVSEAAIEDRVQREVQCRVDEVRQELRGVAERRLRAQLLEKLKPIVRRQLEEELRPLVLEELRAGGAAHAGRAVMSVPGNAAHGELVPDCPGRQRARGSSRLPQCGAGQRRDGPARKPLSMLAATVDNVRAGR